MRLEQNISNHSSKYQNLIILADAACLIFSLQSPYDIYYVKFYVKFISFYLKVGPKAVRELFNRCQPNLEGVPATYLHL